MAEASLRAGDFWLSPEFLADDLFLHSPLPGTKRASAGLFNTGLPATVFDPKPVSAVDPAAETDSDEEDYLAGLTRQMAQAFLHEDDDRPSLLARDPYPKRRAMAGSPQSTLCDLGIWSGSNKGSPTGLSLGPSPPSTPLEQRRGDPRDVLSAAAGEVARMRLTEHMKALHGRGIFGLPAQTDGPQKHRPTALYDALPVFTQQQLQAERFYQLRQQQLMKEQVSAAWRRQHKRGGEGYGEVRAGGGGRAGLGLQPAAWHPVQQQQQLRQGSGMRAVFLANNGTRKESTGTGVFLPRRHGNPTDHRKKPGCSTVLLPERVVQALNLKLGDTENHRQNPGGYLPHYNGMAALGGGAGGSLPASYQKRGGHYRNAPPPAAAQGHEVRLPVDWTY